MENKVKSFSNSCAKLSNLLQKISEIRDLRKQPVCLYERKLIEEPGGKSRQGPSNQTIVCFD
jgi:hypothetical protein